MLDPYIPTPLYSKVKLGHDYEVDFAWLYNDSFGPEWRLIEIEGPTAVLFTKSGNASATLTHAIQQARDWCDWIHQYLEYGQGLIPRISYPFCYIFLGRRKELTGPAASHALTICCSSLGPEALRRVGKGLSFSITSFQAPLLPMM